MTTPEAEQSESVSAAEEPLAEGAGSGSALGTGAVSAASGEPAEVGEDPVGSGEAAGTHEGFIVSGEAPVTGEGSTASPEAAETGEGGSGGSSGPRPEERLERAVRAAEQALIEYEIAVETFRVEVENFSRLHHQKLGPMYARLDELEAEIAEARAARSGDPEDIRLAHEARSRVMPMPGVEELFHGWMDSEGLFPEAQAMLTDQPVRPPQRVRPSEEARRLYRELARKAHPDLAQDEAERKRRDEFISRVNVAYARGDEAQLRELSEEWAAGPVPEERRPSPSEELYARLEWLAQRKDLLTLVAQELEESAIGSMLRLAPDDPDSLLNEIAEQLLAQVTQKEAELAALRG
ncbi:J domain-containing protein [Streptomyces sp. NPDC008222]|uniref:J domain-containing protein n=1 Tax=Streptomyces sp. NPDC008222 TaxID=3364820 RepID=UPI0036E33E17